MRAARVAALYDVHGNLPALEAVLAQVEREDVDLIVVGGDVAWGPLPDETVRRLRALGERAVFVRGNADREVGHRFDVAHGLDEPTAAINMWCADRLTHEEREWLRTLDDTTQVTVESLGRVLFCHGSPRADDESLTVETPSERLRAALQGVDAHAVVCGHTHMQFDLVHDGIRVVNAGSVGLPYQGRAGAYWALLAADVDLRRTEYDVREAVARFRAGECPFVEQAFVDPLLDPPPPHEVARHFESLEAARER